MENIRSSEAARIADEYNASTNGEYVAICRKILKAAKYGQYSLSLPEDIVISLDKNGEVLLTDFGKFLLKSLKVNGFKIRRVNHIRNSYKSVSFEAVWK